MLVGILQDVMFIRKSVKCRRGMQIRASSRGRVMQSRGKCCVFTVPRPLLGKQLFCNIDQLGKLGSVGPYVGLT